MRECPRCHGQMIAGMCLQCGHEVGESLELGQKYGPKPERPLPNRVRELVKEKPQE